MKQISGRVLVKETHSGIPNLIVTAYDCEGPSRELLGERSRREDFSIEHLGKRIGSVLTDQNGDFVLRSENLEFQGNEARPDLLLVVFAPEDVQDVTAPYPLTPKERILYISSVAREGAGAEEAFVIRLLRTQLDHFCIPAATSNRESNTGDKSLATAIEGAWDLADRLRGRLKPRLRQEQEDIERRQSKAEQKVRHLSAIPRHLRNDALANNALLINGKKDLPDSLKHKQDQVIANGYARLGTRTTTMRLRLTVPELKELGLTLEEGQLVGNVLPEQLTKRVRATIGGADLIRKRGLNNPSPEALIKKYLLATPIPVHAKDETHDG